MDPQLDPQRDAFDVYYVLDPHDGLVEIPHEFICRDYRHTYALNHEDLKSMSANGWLNSFDACAPLSKQSIRSRAVVVIANTIEDDPETEYTWCLRCTFTTSHSHSQGYPNEFGSYILLPIPPLHALHAFESWKYDHILMSSWLIQHFKPSSSAFHWSSIQCADGISKKPRSVKIARMETVCAIQHNRPAVKGKSREQRKTPITLLAKLALPSLVRNPRGGAHPRFSSDLANGVDGVDGSIRFTASDDTGWNVLCDDLTEMIFTSLATECIDAPRGNESNRLWFTLRRVCKASKLAVESTTSRFMKKGCELMTACMREDTPLGPGYGYVDRALKVQNHMLPRAIIPSDFYFEMLNLEKPWESFFPYARLRFGMSMKKPLPKAVPRPRPVRQVPPMPPPPQPLRSSLRLGAMKQTTGFQKVSLVMKAPPPTAPPTAPPPPPPPPLGVEMDLWVECSHCLVWRRMPSGTGLIPNVWTCSMHPSGRLVCASGRQTRRTVRQRKY